MQRWIVPFVIVVALITASVSANTDEGVGRVTRIQKSAVAIQDAMPRALNVGTEIFKGDVISTGIGARLEVTLNDKSTFTLGERTHFVVEEFLAGNADNNIVLRMLQGAFSATSGELMKTANASMTIETPAATIGIRGTTVWGGNIDGAFNVALISGKGAYVKTPKGFVELDKPGQGTTIDTRLERPAKPVNWPQAKLKKAHDITGFTN